MIVRDILVVLLFVVVHVVRPMLQGVNLDADLIDRDIFSLLHDDALQTLKRFQRHQLVQFLHRLFHIVVCGAVFQGHIYMIELVGDLVDLRQVAAHGVLVAHEQLDAALHAHFYGAHHVHHHFVRALDANRGN